MTAQLAWAVLIAFYTLLVLGLLVVVLLPWWRHRQERRDNVRALRKLVKRRDAGRDWYDPREFRR